MQTKFKNIIWKACLLGATISLLATTIAMAASGDLDPTFDGDGLVVTDINSNRLDYVRNLAIQPDGKIVVVGNSFVSGTSTYDIVVARYNTDGTLDHTFSGDGKTITNLGGREQGQEIFVQTDGKIVVAGQRCNNSWTCDIAIIRYNANGTLDTTFNGTGEVWTDFGGNDNGSAGGLDVLPNGKIIVSGYMWNGTNYDFAVYRYNNNGILDTTFSSDGKVNIDFNGGKQDTAYGLVRQSDGKLIVVGETCTSSYTTCDFAIARLNGNGTLDKTFSGDGKQITNFGAYDIASAVALQPDGKIVAVGRKSTSSLSYFAIARYNANGSLDTTFSSTGKRIFNVVSNKDSIASDVIVQPDNSIVISGRVSDGSVNNFALVRLNNNGGFDTTLNSNGKLVIDFGGDDFSYALLMQPSDGAYVLGGSSDVIGGQRNFALARVLP